MAAQTEKTTKPPYVSFTTFTNLINRLREIGVPSRIDASVFAGQSGSAISALLVGMRYLKLIDDAGNPMDEFRQLVDAKDEDRGPILKKILLDRYDFITNAGIDLKSASAKQVEEAFRDQGIDGSTISKSVAFFLAAAQVAGLALSPHVKAPKPPRTGNGGKRKRAAAVAPVQPSQPALAPTPSPAEMLLKKFPDFDPTWPDNIKAQWFESFGKLRGMLE